PVNPRRAIVVVVALVAAGSFVACSATPARPGSSDLASATPSDAAVADGDHDLAMAPDLSTPAPPDLAVPSDLALPPDLGPSLPGLTWPPGQAFPTFGA